MRSVGHVGSHAVYADMTDDRKALLFMRRYSNIGHNTTFGWIKPFKRRTHAWSLFVKIKLSLKAIVVGIPGKEEVL